MSGGLDTSYALGNGGPNKGLTDEQERAGFVSQTRNRSGWQDNAGALDVHSQFGVLDHHSADERGGYTNGK
jgi:hypothetical protein